MAENVNGPHLIESAAEREIREQTEERRRQGQYRKLQVVFNGILAAFSILTAGVVSYQNHVLNLSLIETKRQAGATIDSAKAAQDAVAVARQTLASGNESFAKTLAEMKAQNKASLDVADSAKRSVDVGKKSLDASIATSRVDQRPWIRIGEFMLSSEPEEGKAIFVAFVILNSGKSPAFDEVAQARLMAWTSPPEFTKFEESRRSVAVVPPGETHVRSTTGPFIVPNEWIIMYKNKQAAIFLHAMATYTDTFGTHHWTKVCLAHTVGQALDAFAYCPSDNEMDQN